MKTVVRLFSLAVVCSLFLSAWVLPQDLSRPELSVQTVKVGPIDTILAARTKGLGESFSASDLTSEYIVDVSWTVYQQCLFGNYMAVTLYRNDVSIYSYTYPGTGWGYGWSTTFHDAVGPGKSYTYKLVRYTTDYGLCNDTWAPTDAGSTKQLQPPTSLSVTNPTNSDRYISMSWSNGSALTSYYRIYENGVQIATTSATSYTVSTTPGKTSNWGVATYSGYYGLNSAIVQSSMSTAAFKKPESVFATQDTTIGCVRLGWTCASDYATDFQIFRDDALFATVPVSQKQYSDSAVIPNQLYKYNVRSYNGSSGLFTTDPAGDRFGRAAFLNASDGTYDGKIYVNWTAFPSGFENELKLYRDGVKLDGVYANQVEKYDEQIVPGKAHKYVLEVLKDSHLLLTISDYGFAPADGSVKGSVTTPTGAGGVKNVEMRASTPAASMNTTLAFDGVDDYVSTPPLNLASNTVTISAWIKRNGTQNDWAAVLCSKDRSTAAGIYVLNTGELRYNWNDQSATYQWPSGLIVPDGKWTFVALVIQPDRATLYMNDTSSVNIVPHALEEFDGMLEIGRDKASATRCFKGMIDEICVWKVAHTADQLALDRHHILRGNEAALAAYWRVGGSDVVPDFAAGGNHHGTPFGGPVTVADGPPVWHYGTTLTNGSYTIPRILWEENADFTIKPFKSGHGFKGSNFHQDSLVLPFTQNEHIYTAINFLDTTSIEISGWAYLTTVPPYPLPGAKVLLNSAQTGESTDSSGHFSTSVGEAGKYTIALDYLNHKFIPADTLLDLQDPVTNLVFRDTTKRTLSGRVYGGCNNFLGSADIRVRSLAVGYVDTTVHTDGSGNFRLILPAQRYSSQLIRIDNPDSLTIIGYFSQDTVDISQRDTTHNYAYHSPPIVRISDLPPSGCGIYSVPILEQERTTAMRIDVSEKYGAVECPASNGTISFADHVAYVNPDTTILLVNGRAYYPLTPGYPELTGGGPHPHQKQLIVKTRVDKYTRFDTLWVFVRGHKPRQFKFSTVSPQIPLMILRDPPGDKSYSSIASSTSLSITIGFSTLTELGVGIYGKWKVGGGGDVPGLGSSGAWLGGEFTAMAGLRLATSGSQQIKMSTTQTLKTSDADKITGAPGDVFMGAAINILYALTDIVEYDTVHCTAVLDTGITWNGNGFKTTYLYTESHIRQSVIPGLQALATVLSSSPVKRTRDSADVVLNQISVWQQLLDYNTTLKQNAVRIPQYPSNISFSAGTNINNQTTITSTHSMSIGVNFFINLDAAVGAGIKAGDFNEAEGGVKISAKIDIGVTGAVTYEETNTIGFELADDDADPPGDVFTVDILGDPVYGTPVFKLLSGTSSCPWEHPTSPREGVGLGMNTHVATGIPPEIPAQFDLYLYNLTQNNETRTYKLSVIQGSNPDGAIISVGGAVLGSDELQFSLPPNSTSPQRATLRVAREVGSVYDYDNLQIHLYSPCDAQIDTTVSFSVHFIKPCSDVRVVQPARNWITNAGSNGNMRIVLKDYDAANQNMQQLTCEYRLRGTTEWTQLFAYPRALLPADSISYIWNMTAVPEGAYELQATTHCTLGSFSTRAYAGVFDRTPPAAIGSPQPADGSLDPGDDIRIVFTEPIDVATAVPANIALRNTTKGLDILITILCKGDTLMIAPKTASDLVPGDSMQVTISAVGDPYGNILANPISWKFIVGGSTLVKDGSKVIPKDFVLEQCHPNPFNPQTHIRFGIPKAADVSLAVYDLKGREVARPVRQMLTPGYYEVTFEAVNLSSGIYFYQLRADKYRSVKKMVLLK